MFVHTYICMYVHLHITYKSTKNKSNSDGEKWACADNHLTKKAQQRPHSKLKCKQQHSTTPKLTETHHPKGHVHTKGNNYKYYNNNVIWSLQTVGLLIIVSRLATTAICIATHPQVWC